MNHTYHTSTRKALSKALYSVRDERYRFDRSFRRFAGSLNVRLSFCSKGFSLLETMIVVAIIGVMAAISIPSLRAWLPHYKLRSATSDIVGILYLSKMRAVATGHNVYVDFDHNGDGAVTENVVTSYLDTDDDGSRGSVDNNNNENEFTQSQAILPELMDSIPVLELPGQIRIGAIAEADEVPNGSDIADGVETNNDRIEFHPSGRVTMNGDGTLPTIYLCNDREEQRAIQVNMMGQIKVFKLEGSDWES